MHDRNLQVLAIEFFKNNRGISSSIMKDIIKPRDEHPHNLRCTSQFSAQLLRTVFHNTESISFIGPKIYNIAKDLQSSTRNF